MTRRDRRHDTLELPILWRRPFPTSDLPEVRRRYPRDTASQAQTIPLPVL